jgi:excisionase family DNA binding protein
MAYARKERVKQYQEDVILTIEEVARYLKISVTSVYKLARAGEIPAFKVLNKWRFDRREVDKLVRSGRGIA